MTTRAAFLAAIRSRPDEDLPRLVFADWLDENGEGERAEFIRKPIPRQYPVGLWRSWRRKAHSYLCPSLTFGVNISFCCTRPHWTPVACFTSRLFSFEVKHGFAEVVHTRIKGFLKHAASLASANPLRYVTIAELLHPDWHPGERGIVGDSRIFDRAERSWLKHKFPGQLWSHLPKPVESFGKGRYEFVSYANRHQARHAASHAAVNYARSLASDPPISWNHDDLITGAADSERERMLSGQHPVYDMR